MSGNSADSRGVIEAAELVDSGAFDTSFYLRMAGKRTSQNAARNYLMHGRQKAIAPHPLIEYEYIDSAVWERMRKGNLSALLDWLRSPQARKVAWGPLFDPRDLDGADPLMVLRELNDDDLVPVPADFVGTVPTLAAVRSSIVAWQETYRDELQLALPSRRNHWDENETEIWFQSLGSHATGLVSVIMPAKNRDDTISAAIDSVLAQSYRNFELIIIDDGSTDSTHEIAAAYAARDSRVRVIEGPHRGVGPARTAGLAVHKGEFVAFLDSDNTWTTDFLLYSLRALSADKAVVATHTGLRLHGDGGSVEYRGGNVSPAALQLGNSIDINVLVARSTSVQAAGGFDDSLRRWVDYDLVLRLARQGELRYLPFIGCDYSNHARADRITRRESPHWEWVVKGKNLVDWSKIQQALPDRKGGRISIIVVANGAFFGPRRVVDSALREDIDDLEVIVVDSGSSASVGRRLVATYVNDTRVRYIRLPANPLFPNAANVGFAQSTGEYVAFISGSATPRDGWLKAMVRKRSESDALATQALVVQHGGSVLSAGYAFLRGSMPTSFLAGHPVEDAREADLEGLTAVSRLALLVNANSFARLRGFDPFFVDGFEDVDFFLRARHEFGPSNSLLNVASDAIVLVDVRTSPGSERRRIESGRLLEERWAQAEPPNDASRYEARAFRVAHLVPGQGSAKPFSSPLLVRDRAPGSLRWAIKIGANYTQDRWGDVPFADDLARALRRLGQNVVIDRHGAHDRASTYLDDVVVAIRGRHEIRPQYGATNILWVISRPELVTVEEVRGYEAVYAASEKWADWMSAQSGRRVEVLHQATDPERFRPDLEPLEGADEMVFVGAPRLEEGEEYGRRLVGLAVQANAPLGVWGHGWEKFVPEAHVREGFLDFSLTPRVYRSAQIGLNDHWADMKEWGFISNRAFDIVASGTPVISDEIDGLELFEGAVASANSVEEMTQLVMDRSWLPSQECMVEISEMVRREHSFDARATKLLRTALDLRDQVPLRAPRDGRRQ